MPWPALVSIRIRSGFVYTHTHREFKHQPQQNNVTSKLIDDHNVRGIVEKTEMYLDFRKKMTFGTAQLLTCLLTFPISH